jgi:sortase (surface protein transpeptidase)
MPAQSYSTDIMNSLLADHYAQCISIRVTVPQQTRCYKLGQCSSIQNKTWTDLSQEYDKEKITLFLYHL